jgi:hypothetical protein
MGGGDLLLLSTDITGQIRLNGPIREACIKYTDYQ